MWSPIDGDMGCARKEEMFVSLLPNFKTRASISEQSSLSSAQI